MENIDKIKCILIDFEIADKTLDEAANEILLLFSVSGSLCDYCKDYRTAVCCQTCLDEMINHTANTQ
jgi:hypothetical protein